MDHLLKFYSFVAIPYFYLPRFDPKKGAFMDAIFRNITHADIWVLDRSYAYYYIE